MTEATNIPNSQLWNVARTIASTAVDVATANVTATEDTTLDDLDHDAVTEQFEQAAEDHDVWPFEDADDLLSVVDTETSLQGTPDGNYALSKRVDKRLKKLRDPDENVTFDAEENATSNHDEQQTPDQQVTAEMANPEWEIATDIYYCFLGDENNSYPEIAQKYDSPFPDSSAALTEIMNTAGDTDDRIEQIADWVGEWLNNTDDVSRVNRDITELQWARN